MNERLILMRERYLALIASTGATRGAPADRPSGTFQHFESEDQRQQHLREVEEAQTKFNAPF